MKRTKLTKKQRIFVEEFLRTWKPADAARRAGYRHPDAQGSQILKKPLVEKLISERMEEISMQTNEVLTRLTQQARVNLGDFLIIEKVLDTKTGLIKEKVNIDWSMVKEHGYLIKELNWSRRGDPVLRLHDSQAALIQIGRARRLFVEQIEETHKVDQTNVNIYIPANGRDPVPGDLSAEGHDLCAPASEEDDANN